MPAPTAPASLAEPTRVRLLHTVATSPGGITVGRLTELLGISQSGIGKALVRQQVIAADDAGLWTLQTAVFTENRASIALHHSAGYRTVGIRGRIAQRDGAWHDTVLLERRADSVSQPDR